jgi:hypothetical protein
VHGDGVEFSNAQSSNVYVYVWCSCAPQVDVTEGKSCVCIFVPVPMLPGFQKVGQPSACLTFNCPCTRACAALSLSPAALRGGFSNTLKSLTNLCAPFRMLT